MSSAVETSGSASDRQLYVVDASVASKWLLRDEPGTSGADLVLADAREGRVDLIAPAHLRYEVVSAVRNAVRANRVEPGDARAAIADFLSWGIAVVDDGALIEAGYEQAMRVNCSLYDGCYVALAELLDVTLIYADRRLRNALGPTFHRGIWLDDYASHR